MAINVINAFVLKAGASAKNSHVVLCQMASVTKRWNIMILLLSIYGVEVEDLLVRQMFLSVEDGEDDVAKGWEVEAGGPFATLQGPEVY